MREIDLIHKQLETAKTNGLILNYSDMVDLKDGLTISIRVYFTPETRYKTKEHLRDFLMRNYSTVAATISTDESYMTIISM